jgi:hypothetical protein
MPLVSHIVYGIAAAVVVLAALKTAWLSGGRSVVGPALVVVLVGSWALCVWLTPLGPQLWRASSLGLLAAGAFLVVSLDGARGISLFTRHPNMPALRRAAWLVLLMFALPVIAHLSGLGGASDPR